MKKENILLCLNAGIFGALLFIPEDMNGRIHPLSLEASHAVKFAVACGGIIVSIATLAYHRRRWVIPALCLAVSSLCILKYILWRI